MQRDREREGEWGLYSEHKLNKQTHKAFEFYNCNPNGIAYFSRKNYKLKKQHGMFFILKSSIVKFIYKFILHQK